ncbi:MAG: hypothetical protein WA152_04780 [Microgenomates group bacterium]
MEALLMGSIFVFSASTLISYILIVLNIPHLIIPLFILSLILSFKSLVKLIKTVKISLNWQTLLVAVVFIFGIVGQLAVISPSGIYQNGDLVFWSAHGHDGPWHIALMEEMKKGYPFTNPIFAGEKLVNYHFFSDILPMVFSKYLKLSDLDLYFRIFPFIYSVFLGASAFYLTKKITSNFSSSLWATIFTYFAGSFGFIVTYLKGGTIGGESIFWATQPQSSGGNPPQIISNFLFLASIYFVLIFLEQKEYKAKVKYFLISLVILGTISSFKIYAGVILLLTLSAIGTWNLVFKKDFRLFSLSLLSGIMALALYLPNSSNSGSFLIWEPWWYIRTMIVEPSRLNLLDWELRRQTYIYESNWKRVIWLEGWGFIIFFFGNLGMRFLGLWEYLKSNAIFKISIILSLVLPLLFLQKGVASNTAQFLQYFILLFGILAGIRASKITAKFKFVIPVIFILMIPTQVGLLREFYSRPAFAKISSQELEALKFIKENTDENTTILTPPYNQYLDQKQITPNVWDWFDTSYVSAFSARRTYFDDYEQVDIMGYNYKPRLKLKETVFVEKDTIKVKNAILSSESDLVYFPKDVKPLVNMNEIGLTKFYENSSVEVWKSN